MYIVSGASTGIGRAVAAAIASRKLTVMAVARSAEKLESLAEQYHPWIRTVAADLASAAGINKVSAAISGENAIAGIVHSAGSLVPLEPYDSIQATALVDHFRIHVGAPLALHQSIANEHNIDRVVFIDSYSAASPRHGWAAYSIVKAAAQMAARCASQELSDSGIIRVFPGAVKTRIVDEVMKSDTETAKAFASMLDRGELAKPHEVAEFISSLLIDAPVDLLQTRESWDYNCDADRATVIRLQRTKG